MNRSIFQIWQPLKWFNVLYAIIISFFIFFYSNLLNNVFCSNLRGISEFSKYALIESNYNNVKFFKSNSINQQDSNLGLDIFLDCINNKNSLNYQISKYFLNKNGILYSFNKKSPYSHPNLFVGIWNNIYFNYQFSHDKALNHFNIFSKKDLYGFRFDQFLSYRLYMYDANLSQIMLNYNSLNFNNQFLPANKNLIDFNCSEPIKIQNYLHSSFKGFEKVVNDSLKN